MVDPISLLAIGTGIAGLAGAGATAVTALNKPKAPAAPSAPPTPAPIQQPVGSATSQAPTGTPSFLAAAAAPQQQNTAGKTLLGQ